MPCRSFKQLVGHPITCWCPAQFTDSHVDYADSICWVSNTYYLPMISWGWQTTHTVCTCSDWTPWVVCAMFDDLLTYLLSADDRDDSRWTTGAQEPCHDQLRLLLNTTSSSSTTVTTTTTTTTTGAMISYYQWVPLILLSQALCVFVPCLVWRFLNRRSGINMTAVMDAARVCSQAHFLEIREKVTTTTLRPNFRPLALVRSNEIKQNKTKQNKTTGEVDSV